MKIALIGPGIMPIPPQNWGAVESLIWDQYEYLSKKGHTVDIINTSDLQAVADRVNQTDYDFVHLHYDDHARVLTNLLQKPFCTTTHYGYIKEHYPNYYGWKPIFDGVLRSPGIISLAPEISSLFRQSGYSSFLRHLRNGARVTEFNFTSNPTKYGLCLGKVEPRKRQADLSYACKNRNRIDFVGPVIDGSFQENETCRYGGIWTKPNLYHNMTNYRCLILLSDGEAAPLVVPEALSAGLSLVVSPTAAANLNTSLPFIHVLNGPIDESINETIGKAIEDNDKYRDDIRQYALDNFDWNIVCDDYIKIMKEFINENSLCNNSH